MLKNEVKETCTAETLMVKCPHFLLPIVHEAGR